MESLYRYPRGLSGIALLLLRISVGLLLLADAQGEVLFSIPNVPTFFIAALCCGICIGVFTPVLSGMALIGGIAYLIWTPTCPCLVRLVTLALCISTAILGAGAFSIDGILFGRRRVIL